MIRRGGFLDHPWVIEEGARAYADLGDYRRILPSWLAQPGVMVFLEEDETSARTRRGFAMLGFYLEPAPQLGEGASQSVADLLALAVAPPFQRQGLGKALLRHVMATAARVAESTGAWELRLTVAANNHVAQRMYERAGFSRAPEVPAVSYERGQAAVRMVRELSTLRAAR